MAQSAAGGLGVPVRHLSVRPHANLRRFRRWCCRRQWHHQCDILTPPMSYLIFTLERDALLCILLDCYNISRVNIIPVGRPPGSATAVLPTLHERLHHFEAEPLWDLLLLSDWIDTPGLECHPLQIADVPPSCAESGLHSSHHCYLLVAHVMRSRGEFRWDGCRRWLWLQCLLDLLLWRLLPRLLWGR